MRIVIETETSNNSVTGAATPSADGVLTIDAGPPPESLVTAIAAAGGMTGSAPSPPPIDAGPAPAF